jgi:hypothetical protein
MNVHSVLGRIIRRATIRASIKLQRLRWAIKSNRSSFAINTLQFADFVNVLTTTQYNSHKTYQEDAKNLRQSLTARITVITSSFRTKNIYVISSCRSVADVVHAAYRCSTEDQTEKSPAAKRRSLGPQTG